jgi:hypothetical protein
VPAYTDLLNKLSSFGGGPIVVRVGGGSTDHQTIVPPAYVWDSLNRLHAATGARFILGVNLESGDAALARRQMEAAEARLAPGSILAFEIGNEVRLVSQGGGWAVLPGV